MKKPSFFSRITGDSEEAEVDDFFKSDDAKKIPLQGNDRERHAHLKAKGDDAQGTESEGELRVDVYQTPDHIVIKAFVAGVQPQSIDISLTREMLTISGLREEEKEVEEEYYYQRELYWGSFTRTILLPEEVDVDLAEASEKHGILMIRLPKVNKKRQTKLKIRSR